MQNMGMDSSLADVSPGVCQRKAGASVEFGLLAPLNISMFSVAMGGVQMALPCECDPCCDKQEPVPYL